jgi:2-phospho-L-lactate guanylyltransferase
LNESKKTWALMPVKAFDQAKTRLRATLTAGQCSALARNMAADVVIALQDAKLLHGISLLGSEPVVAEFAREMSCEFLAEDPESGLSANLDTGAGKLQREQVDRLLVVPGDLPMLHAADIDQLLSEHSGGLSVCPASRDGGTNALVISPPGAIKFCFGEHSARRHQEAAHAVNLPCRNSSHTAFSRDIDTPEDLIWFCQHSPPGLTSDYLTQTGICEKLLGSGTVAVA